MFKEKLTTATAWREKVSFAIYAHCCDKSPATRGTQLRDQTTFGTEAKSVTRIFDITTDHNPTIVYKCGNADGKL
jgi:hypothetical protein